MSATSAATFNEPESMSSIRAHNVFMDIVGDSTPIAFGSIMVAEPCFGLMTALTNKIRRPFSADQSNIIDWSARSVHFVITKDDETLYAGVFFRRSFIS